MSNYIYETNFTLKRKVKDYEKAKKYLLEDDMLDYYDDPKDITSIEWLLDTEKRGRVRVVSKSELDENTLEDLSNYISGQNSDGMGEGFECQDFGSSFNWEKDTYKLERIK